MNRTEQSKVIYFGEKFGQRNMAWKQNTLDDIIQNHCVKFF